MNESRFGFAVKKVTPLPELDGRLHHMVHERTGLELVWLERDEENKTFGIAFETLPWDDTGVFHILEHSVLCGSEKYPVKEPFVELMKSSLNTFLNALTFQDKTFYPISSRNDKDFLNLMRVYLDAVFCPMIYTRPEIFDQEGWHYELDESGKASYKGVVFNEMKGVFANADELVVSRLNRLLFPQSPYRFVSGGDPAAIPDLMYETFVDSHRRYYAPSNAYVFLDGSIDVEAVLGILDGEYLCRYEKTERMAPPALQKAVSGRSEGVYELTPGEAPTGKTRLSLGKVIGTFDEREKIVAMQVLAEVLCGSNQSPLPKALLGRGLAEEVNMGVNDGMLQPWVIVDVKNLREENLDEVREVLRAQLMQLADEGVDRAQLEAVMANTEFKMRERDYGRYPQGLIFGFSVLESWLYGGDPAANLEVGELFTELRRKMDQGYFERLLRELLLDNPHSAEVVLRPSHTAGEERRAAEQQRLEKETAAWSAEEHRAIEARQARLLAWQESVDTAEALATIPQLTLEDIPVQPERIPTETTELAGLPVILHELHTGGIAYVSLYFDADGCGEEELSVLAFACAMLGESDTRCRSAEEVLIRTRLLCGNFGIYPVTYVVNNDPEQVTNKLCVSFSALESNLEKALEHVVEVVRQSCFCAENTRDILRQTRMEVFQRTVMEGNSVALSRVRGQFCAAGVADDCTSGVGYYQWLKKMDDNWDFAALNGQMTGLLEHIINKNALTLSVCGVSREKAETLARAAAQLIPEKETMDRQSLFPWGKRKEGIAVPADISFAVMGGNFRENGVYSGKMQLAAQIIRLGYLWNVIRVQGGAYGTGMVISPSGLCACTSFRDPAGAASLERYRECASFLRQAARQEQDLTGFIIGTVANASPLMMPRTKAAAGDSDYFTGTTWEERCENRRQLLHTTHQDLLEAADILDKTLADGGICLIGGQEQLDKCVQLETVMVL